MHARRGVEWLHVPKGLVLGVSEEADYKTERILLHPGDTIFLYTDGVTEAMDSSKHFYSDKRLLQSLEEKTDTSSEVLVGHVMHSVKDFTGDEPQSDDITIVAVQFRGNGDDGPVTA